MFQLLEVNSYPENANYLYDPYFNNCATKLRDITKEILGDQVQFPSSFSNEDYTMRQLMNKELPWNTWGNFGINLALGNTLDKAITSEEYMYLPDYVYKAFKRAKKSDVTYVISIKTHSYQWLEGSAYWESPTLEIPYTKENEEALKMHKEGKAKQRQGV